MPTVQTRLKELTLRFDPELLTRVLSDREGQVWEIPNTEESTCYAFQLIESTDTLGDNSMQHVTDEQRLAEATVENVFRIIGMHNGEYAAVPVGDIDVNGTRGTVWLPRMDETLIVMDMPNTLLDYGDLLESSHGSFGNSDSFLIDVMFQEKIVQLELLIEQYGNECTVNGTGNFAIFHLRDILTNTDFAFSVRTDANSEISNVLDAITANPQLLLTNFPDCIELVAIGATLVRTTWNSVMVPYKDLVAGEPATGTDTKPNLVSLLTEPPMQSEEESDDDESEEEGGFDTEWLNSNGPVNPPHP